MSAPVPLLDPPERPIFGMAMRLGSATLFAAMAMLLKLSSDRGISAAEMIFYRNGFALPVVIGWILIGPGFGAIRTRRPLAHLTRSAIGLSSMLCTFGALALLPLAEATTITYAAPILSTLLSAMLLKEAVGGRRWAAVLIGFVGVLLVVHPGGTALPAIGIVVALAAALSQSAVMIAVRQLGRSETIAAIVFWFTLSTTIAGAALLPLFGHWPDLPTFALLVGAGLFGGAAQLMMTGSLLYGRIVTVVPFDYAQILWATLFGWLVFAATPPSTTLAGAALIAGSGIYTAYRESRRGRETNQALSPPEG